VVAQGNFCRLEIHLLNKEVRLKMNIFPNFFIVGAARSGTSSLDQYLSQHPEIYIPAKKDIHFFADESFLRCLGPGDDRLHKLLIRDEASYTQLFAKGAGAKAIGESSAFYLYFPDTAERIAQTVPDARIIIILREPVERAYSAYTFLVRDGRETLGFEAGLGKEEERKHKGFEPLWWYRELSLYSKQIKHYQDVFGAKQVKVLLYDELFAKPGQALQDIFAFLNVKDDIVVNTSVRYNASGVPKSRKLYSILDKFIYNPNALQKYVKSLVPSHLRVQWASKVISMSVDRVPVDHQIQMKLKEYFTEEVRALEELLGRDLSCWGY
jgi:hypothetical protein